MHKLILTFSIVLLVAASCKKLEKLTRFTMDYEENFTIPENNLVNVPLPLMSDDIETNSEYEFELNDTKAELIEDIKLLQLKFEITEPDSINFSYLHSVYVYITAEGLESKTVAWIEEVPADISNILELNTTNENLMEFLKRKKFALLLKTLTDETVETEHMVNMKAAFIVDAKILGQ